MVNRDRVKQAAVQDHSQQALCFSQRNTNTMLLDSTAVAFEILAGCMLLLGNG